MLFITKRKYDIKRFQNTTIEILKACRKPVSLHYIKDKLGFNNKWLKIHMDDVVNRNLVTIIIEEQNDKCIRKKVIITGQGKLLLRKEGILY